MKIISSSQMVPATKVDSALLCPSLSRSSMALEVRKYLFFFLKPLFKKCLVPDGPQKILLELVIHSHIF